METQWFNIMTIASLLFTTPVFAKMVDTTTAHQVGINYYYEAYAFKHSIPYETLKASIHHVEFSADGKPLLYYVNIEPKGYLIISGDDRAYPVLSYNTTETWNDEAWYKLPPVALEIINGYAQQMEVIIQENGVQSDEIKELWEKYLDIEKGSQIITRASGELEVLGNLHWSQDTLYNAMCPQTGGIHPPGLDGYDDKCPAGCVAVAMTQIMKYWEWPENGEGSHSYVDPPNAAGNTPCDQADPSYGEQAADFSVANYNWSNMPNTVNTTNDDVAQIIRHAGVAANMDYSYCGSGTNINNTRNALVNHFRYTPNATVLSKTADISWFNWEKMIKAEVEAMRPVYYRGSLANGGGHALAIWAYEEVSSYFKFKFNWGWGGTHNNTWYTLRNISGEDLINFSNNQSIIQGLYPQNENTIIEACPDMPTVEYGGQTYNTIKIGDHCWIRENMNVGSMLQSNQSSGNNGIIEKYCYNNNPQNCETYGALYSWDEMMQYATDEGAQGICPEGWHIPTDEEWQTLSGNIDSQYPAGDPVWNNTGWRGSDAGGKMKSTGIDLWKTPNIGATNESGFTAYPGGNFNTIFNSFREMGDYAYFWSSTPQSTTSVYYHRLDYNDSRVYRQIRSKGFRLSVRCVREVPDFYANFTASNTNALIGEAIHFSDLSFSDPPPNSWAWNFGDFSTGNNRFQQNPVHFYTKSGLYNISLTITNALGLSYSVSKEHYIAVESDVSGIRLRIIKTDPNSGPELAKVGYYFKTKVGKEIDLNLTTFDVIDDEAYINDFPALAGLPEGSELITSFDNQIILFDQSNTCRGQIHFEYEPEKELEHGNRRDAILILHNDNEICAGNAFPYSTDSPEYDALWKYYQLDEYPVSMLIPPNNTFQATYSKTPLLLIHGWEGMFELKKNPNARAEDNETSYWFTTVEQLNESSMPFDAWQFYYPYNDAHKHLAICLKSALGKLKSYYPSKKIRIVTHSMGGLVTLRYLTQFPDDAVNKVQKVLFSAPPAHGSLGANLYYKTKYSSDLEKALEMDPNAPAVRDMKLGSEATRFINNYNLPDLNTQNGVSDDYFVLLGTTFHWYLSDKKFQAYDRNWINSYLVPHSSLHPEASNHHDGIVAISSGSLLNKGVGFATFHGNHNDAVHMQSCQRGNQNRQNIGDASLLPNIIKQYFTQTNVLFLSYLQGNSNITTIVKHDRLVQKPINTNLDELNTGNGVDYQKGILNISVSQNTGVDLYHAYYKKKDNILLLSPKRKRFKNWFSGYSKLGVYNQIVNKDQFTNNYYFNDKVLVAKENQSDSKAITYNGCAMDMKQGILSVVIENKKGTTIGIGSVTFRYCETVNKTIIVSGNNSKNTENNFTDTKNREVVSIGKTISDSLLTPFYVDDQATSVRFALSSFEASVSGLQVTLKLKLPNGVVADSTLPGSTFNFDHNLGVVNMEITDPIPGIWHIWLESDQPENDTIAYNALAYIQSDVFAFLPDTTEFIAAGTSRNIKAALQVNDLNLASQLKVMVTIYNPDEEEETYDITANGTVQDSSYIFSHDYIFNNPGQYFIKYNIDGIYNNFNFERCLHQYFEAVDTIPVFSLPDITLRQNESFRELDLLSFIYNISDYDTIYFSSEIIESNVDTTTISVLMDTTATTAWFFSSLADTGMVMMRFVCHYDDESIADTMYVNILVLDLAITAVAVSDTVINNGVEIIVEYTIANTGNSHTGSYEVKYYIIQDSALQVSDFALGSFQVLYHEPDSIINVSDTLTLPQMALAGNYFLMIQADATEVVSEIDETNNQVFIAVTVNPPPDAPVIIAAVPGNEQVQLSYTVGIQEGITGYVIYYGQDTTEVLQKNFPYSADTTYTVTGLFNDSLYCFAVSCYRLFDNPSALSVFVSATPYLAINQTLNIPHGWSGLSSSVSPIPCTIESVLSPILSDLIILQSETGMYWPAQNTNTIGAWNTHEGYKIKVVNAVELTITGSRETNKTLDLAAGWNVIPVLSECAVDVEALFAGKDVVMVKEVAGWYLYWPEYGINTLGGLLPGKAYFVMMGSAEEIEFPECDGTKGNLPGYQNLTGLVDIQTPWPTTQRTTSTHSVAVPEGVAGELFKAGDILGVFDQQGNCSGLGLWQGESTAITLFGNDPTTTAKDGFAEGEPLQFRLYRPESGEEFDLEATFDQSLPNPESVFATHGLSAINSLKASPSSIIDASILPNVSIFPNPASEKFFIIINDKDFNNAVLNIFAIDGTLVKTVLLKSKSSSVRIADLQPGVYILQVDIDGQIVREKLIKN